MKITRVGLDIAKQVFQVHGVDEGGKTRSKIGPPLALHARAAALVRATAAPVFAVSPHDSDASRRHENRGHVRVSGPFHPETPTKSWGRLSQTSIGRLLLVAGITAAKPPKFKRFNT